MRRPIVFSALASFLVACGPTEDAATSTPPPTAPAPPAEEPVAEKEPVSVKDRVAWIRAEYKTIQDSAKAGSWYTEEMDGARFGWQTYGGSRATVLCEPDAGPRRLTLDFAGEYGSAQETLYVKDRELFFALKAVHQVYPQMDGSFSDSTEETRIYWDGSRVVRGIGPDGVVKDLPDGELLEAAAALRQSATEVLEAPGLCPR